MCGLIAAFADSTALEPAIHRSMQQMHRRGPDGEGLWQDSGVCLGHLGVAPLDIYFAPFCVDNAVFALGSGREAARQLQRQKLGVPADAVVVLFASKLIFRKRAADLLKAFEEITSSHKSAFLLIAGSGPEEPVLREAASGSGAKVQFLGFKNQTELPALFAASDIFVLPSAGEPWGLVVNEAMAAGLPVIVSDDVGAAPDLVEGKDTGVVFPVGDIGRLRNALEMLLSSSELRARMGRNAFMHIGQWDVQASANGIANAARAVVAKRTVK